MTPNPATVDADATVVAAARAMRDRDIGTVLAVRDGKLRGILTDRDVVVRAVADGRAAVSTRVDEICSEDPETLSEGQSVDEAIQLMRDRALRRLPVVRGGLPVGIVSLGDLAAARDGASLLAAISAAAPNR